MKCCLFCWSVVSSISWWRLQCASDEFETCTIQVLQLHKFKEMIGEWVSVMKEWILNKLIARIISILWASCSLGTFNTLDQV